MATDVRTFQAESMRDALDRVRKEMGEDAVILHTRQLPQRGVLPWGKRNPLVEITAGLGVNVGAQALTKPPLGMRSSAAAAAVGDAITQQSGASTAPTAAVPPTSSNRVQTSSRSEPQFTSAAETRQEPLAQNSTVSPNAGTVALAKRMLNQSLSEVAEPEAEPSRRNVTEVPHSPPRNNSELAANLPETITELKQQLNSIQQMLAQLGLAAPAEKTIEVPPHLGALHRRLLDCEVEHQLAAQLISELGKQFPAGSPTSEQELLIHLTGLIERRLSIASPFQVQRGRRKVVALVGATGVGKTTTIAKLAANYRLHDGVRMGLVTVDTYRIAAVEQLRTYAEIIDLPMRVVTSPPEMQRALDELVGLDLILIDTAGRSPRDELQVQELRRLLAAAQVDEVHLVLSTTSSLPSLLASAKQFMTASAQSIILTKLDEAHQLGNILNLTQSIDLPLSWVTIGQDVPEDIEPARADRLARLILKRDALRPMV